MEAKPVRLQRSRKKGSKLVSPNALPVVCVTRPKEWGNPFVVGGHYKWGGLRDSGIDTFMIYMQSYAPDPRFHTIADASDAVAWFRELLHRDPSRIGRIRRELAGKNLACWCKIGDCCHADLLIEVANVPEAK